MKAVVLTRHGGPEVLRLADVPEPVPRAGEVRVRVRAIGLNFAEVLSRRGLYSWTPPLPYILGMEAFGDVDGEPVVVGTQFGTYAESLCVPASRVSRFSSCDNCLPNASIKSNCIVGSWSKMPETRQEISGRWASTATS